MSTRIKAFLSIVCLICLSLPGKGMSAEPDGILDFLPSIIAASTQVCDLSELSTCKSDSICARSGGHWYWNQCNLDPVGLVLIRRLSGTWEFQYSINENVSVEVGRFSANTIKLIGNRGDYEIKGKDVKYTGRDRSVTATYLADDEIVKVEFAKGTTTINGRTLTLFPAHFHLSFISAQEMTGLYSNFDFGPTFYPAWSVKR